MARIALPHRGGERQTTFLAAALLVASAAMLAGLLSMVHLPSVATNGLPVDWARRAAWLAVDALFGLALACAVMAAAERAGRR